MSDCIFWIATDSYCHDAIQSAESVANRMPDYPRLIFTPTSFKSLMFNEVIPLPGRQFSLWYLDFTSYMLFALLYLRNLGYKKALYLDTDTYMVEPVPEIFKMLDHFDVLSTIAPARQISPTQAQVPECLAEYNTGVLAFSTVKVEQLFRLWFSIYKSNPGIYGENDQAPLREAIWLSPAVKPYVLPLEYNCRFGFGGQAAGKIKILHGRSNNMKQLAENINKDTGIRGWRRGDYE